jgi:hypothetical protein
LFLGYAGHHISEEEELADCTPKSQPALLTATADGILRVWVEVTMELVQGPNPLAITPAPLNATPGLPGGSHFCVTLVVQPPPGVWGAGHPAGLRAAWGVPDGGVMPFTGPQIRAAKVLWITAVAKVGAAGESPVPFFFFFF